MKHIITVAWPHAKNEDAVVVFDSELNPEDTLDAQKKFMKKLKGAGEHPDFARLVRFEFSRGDHPTVELSPRKESEPKSTPPPAAPKPATPETKTKKG